MQRQIDRHRQAAKLEQVVSSHAKDSTALHQLSFVDLLILKDMMLRYLLVVCWYGRT